jgi:S1-C subfamily serine protease
MKTVAFVSQSITVGLAMAFLVVLIRPSTVNRGQAVVEDSAGSYAKAVAVSAPAVVNIYTAGIPGQRSGFAGLATSPLAGEGLGSGVVISQDGYLVTNWHVIRDADEIYVQLADGRAVQPIFVGADPETELALLRIDLPDLPSIALGRSDTLQTGDIVLAIGNSFGLSQTVTQGIVSATDRGLGVATFESFIQTDAAINIGNSGGALINTRGELIGINTAVLGSTSQDQVVPAGVGFAIPVNLVRGVMTELIEHGRVIRGWLRVDAWYLPTLQAKTLGLYGPGIELLSVSGPASLAGLRRGDVVTHIDDERMLSPQQMMNIVAGATPGQTIRIRGIRRGAGEFEIDAVLEERLQTSQSTG